MKSSKIPSKISHPKAKPKGKYKTPKLREHEDVGNLDFFKVILGADAGADSSSYPNQNLEEEIKKLTQSQLSKLEKLVQSVQKRILNKKIKEKKRKDKCHQMRDAIAQRTVISTQTEAEIALEIRKKLKKLPITKIDRDSKGKIKGVQIKGKSFSLKRLIRNYFDATCTRVAQLLESGQLIRIRKSQRIEYMIEKIILLYLEKEIPK